MNSTTLSEQELKSAGGQIQQIVESTRAIPEAGKQDPSETNCEKNDLNQFAPSSISESFHQAARFPGMPNKVVLPRQDTIVDMPRLQQAAREWSRENGFNPPLHGIAPDSVEWLIDHHPDCRLNYGRECDCGFLLRCRYHGATFVVNMNGSMEDYIEPPSSHYHASEEELEYLDFLYRKFPRLSADLDEDDFDGDDDIPW